MISFAPDGKRWVTQCKRVRSFGKADALEEVRKVLEEPPTPALKVYFLNNLALTLRSQGDASSARKLHEEVLAARRRVLGKEHPDTLRSMWWLCYIQAESDGIEVDQDMVETLLEGVRKLPEGTPVREGVEKWWGSFRE